MSKVETWADLIQCSKAYNLNTEFICPKDRVFYLVVYAILSKW